MSTGTTPPPVPRRVRLVDWYQRGAEGRPSPCRFSPSCSSYAREALLVHGSRRGLWLTVRRLARCRPFGPSGWDPVPAPTDECDHAAHLPRADRRDPDLVPAAGPTKDR